MAEILLHGMMGGVAQDVVILDLDGTLVDPAGAITSGIAAALRDHGVVVPDDQRLKSFVGPPLAASLKSLPGVTEELVPKLIEHYRSGYIREGMDASQVYPGIHELLESLRAAGAALAVATSKPEPLALRLLEVQGLSEFFDVVSGSDPDEAVPHISKGPIIASALERLCISPSGSDQLPAVMVGDRKFDVEGAARLGVPCIGVSWGYAPEGELKQAGVETVVNTAEQLLGEVRRMLVLRGGHQLESAERT